MINTRITYIRGLDNVPIEGVLVRRFTRTNGGKTKDVALIYYNDWVGKRTGHHFEDDDGDVIHDQILAERPVFRYVEVSDDRLKIYENEKSIYEAENMLELMDKYTPESWFIKEFYMEDWMYVFVNYDL